MDAGGRRRAVLVASGRRDVSGRRVAEGIDGAVLTVSDLPFDIQQSVLESEGGKGYSEFDLAQVEKAHIRKVLQYTGGNKTEAARLMHIGLTTLYRKIEEYGIK